MALFDRFKQILIPEKNRSKKAYPTEKPINIGQQNARQIQVTKLTPREHDLYLLLLEGFTLKESAKQLSIKYSTANTHMTNVYKKLEVKSRAQLIINYRNVNGENAPCS